MLEAFFKCGTLGSAVGGAEVVATLNKLGKAENWSDFAKAARHFRLDQPGNGLLKALEATALLNVDDKSERGVALLDELSASAKSSDDWCQLLYWTTGIDQPSRRLDWARQFQGGYPRDPSAWEVLGDEFSSVNEGEEALRAYSRAQSLQEDVNLGLLEKIAECHQMLDDRYQSLAVLTELCRLDSLNPQRWLDLSNEYLKGLVRDPEQSLYCFNRITEIRPHGLEDWLFRAHALDGADFLQEALDACFCGLEIDGHNRRLLTYMAHLLQRLDQPNHRKEVLQLMSKLDPEAGWVQRELASQCSQLLDRAGMEKALEKMRRLDPKTLLKLERWITEQTIQ